MEDKENEKYRKRIKELVDRLEKDKDTPEVFQLLLKRMGQVKQTLISKINPNYRNQRCVIGFVFIIRDYYWLRANPKYPTEKDQFQEEIDYLYKLIYEELKKPSPHIPTRNPNRRNKADIIDKRRILRRMVETLGAENVRNQFYKKFNIYEELQFNPFVRSMTEGQYKCLFAIVIIAIVVVLFVWILRF